MRTVAISVAYFRAPSDQAIRLDLFMYPNIAEYENYSLTLKYGDKERVLSAEEAVKLRNEIFGDVNGIEYPVKTRLLLNDERQYDTDTAIELIERYEVLASPVENTCYVLEDGHVFKDRQAGVANEFPQAFLIGVFADYKMLSFDAYSFDGLLEYLK